jgi:hypothetical protein
MLLYVGRLPLSMFASTVTMNGLRVTIAIIIEITEFLLRKDDRYKNVLTGKLNQDLIEVMMIVNKPLFFSNFIFILKRFFGLIRAAGGSCEKPRTSYFFTILPLVVMLLHD